MFPEDLIGVPGHTAKLEAHERAAVETNAFLPENDGTPHAKPNGNGHQSHHGAEQDENQRGNANVECSLEGSSDGRGMPNLRDLDCCARSGCRADRPNQGATRPARVPSLASTLPHTGWCSAAVIGATNAHARSIAH